jgi:hypothetical protein
MVATLPDGKVGAVAVGPRMPVRRADQEAGLANAVVAPAGQQLGKFLGRGIRAAFVEQDRAERRLWLGDAPAALGQLGQLERPGNALGVSLDQLALRRAADLPAGDYVEQHGSTLGPHAHERNPRPSR